MIIKNYKIIPNFEYNSLVKSREQLAKLQHTMSKLSDRADFLNTIMDHIGDHQETLLDMYDVNGSLFGLFVSPILNRNRPIYVTTRCAAYCNPISMSSSDIVDDVMEIVSVDTKGLHREGHGSRNIQAMIAIARIMKLKKIWGSIWVDTPIGFDNLCCFYQKNGFEIKGKRFYMNLE